MSLRDDCIEAAGRARTEWQRLPTTNHGPMAPMVVDEVLGVVVEHLTERRAYWERRAYNRPPGLEAAIRAAAVGEELARLIGEFSPVTDARKETP